MGVLRVFEGCCRVFEVSLKGVWKKNVENVVVLQKIARKAVEMGPRWRRPESQTLDSRWRTGYGGCENTFLELKKALQGSIIYIASECPFLL